MAVNSYDEWTRLREVVVGRADEYIGHHVDSSFRLFYYDNVRPPSDLSQVTIPTKLLDELLEDLEEFANAITDAGVRVLRPTRLSGRTDITTPLWSAPETAALNVRDQTIILGDTIVETAPHQRARYFENDYLKPIFYDHFRKGSPWISMPSPTLGRCSLDPDFFGDGLEVDFDDAGQIDELGLEIVFDGAQCIRFGKDVLVNVANENHRLGLWWLERQFGDKFRFWTLDAIADSHIDSLIVPLRPGLLLLRNPSIASMLPKPLQTWDKIYPSALAEDKFPDYSSFGFNLASRYIDTNVLSIDEHTVIANALCPDLCEELERNNLDVIRVRHRHRRLFNGGFHCFTLDTIRDGGLESYF